MVVVHDSPDAEALHLGKFEFVMKHMFNIFQELPDINALLSAALCLRKSSSICEFAVSRPEMLIRL